MVTANTNAILKQARHACTQLAKFESIVDDLNPAGGTKIYDAISAGCNMLQPMFKSHPNADLRVLVLTDGESCGGMSASSVLPRIYRIGAVVDAIIVGDRPDPNLVCAHSFVHSHLPFTEHSLARDNGATFS